MKVELSELLEEWQPDIAEPDDFRRSVWTRIQASDRPFLGWREQLRNLMPTPKAAIGIAALAILAGAFSGNLLAQKFGTEAYLRAVNPYAMTR